jgi:hypothetical protein
MPYLLSLLMGTGFGILLAKSQVISWFKIQKMFYFKEPDLYLIIGSAVVVGAATLFLVRRFKIKTVDGKPAVIAPKPLNKGVFFGGILFGIGWFITGSCPGPVYVLLGAGAPLALITLAGALVGTFLYGLLKPRLPH